MAIEFTSSDQRVSLTTRALVESTGEEDPLSTTKAGIEQLAKVYAECLQPAQDNGELPEDANVQSRAVSMPSRQDVTARRPRSSRSRPARDRPDEVPHRMPSQYEPQPARSIRLTPTNTGLPKQPAARTTARQPDHPPQGDHQPPA
jgi:hypothetical protein